jgi:hypothetical protein
MREGAIVMKTSSASKVVVFTMLVALVGALQLALAQDGSDSREDMQRALNKEVMAAPFNPGDIKRAQAYAEEAKKLNVQPVAQPPSYWVPGWTCANMISYSGYFYGDYQSCVYYHHYYGRYWR